ncbi:MAG TPA: hypothetical protein VM819_12555 [Vicinamibacterales bacterium]|nr:hypothetical protein [Vicinamibacterales bacterium]
MTSAALSPAASTAPRIAERRFYLGMTGALSLTVLLGFARTFFFRAWFPDWAAAHGAPERIFFAHGIVFALWYALLVAQASLIAVRRVTLHRRIGFAGAGLAASVVALGTAGSLVAARRPRDSSTSRYRRSSF